MKFLTDMKKQMMNVRRNLKPKKWISSSDRKQQVKDLKEGLGVKDEKISKLLYKLASKEAIEDVNHSKNTLLEE